MGEPPPRVRLGGYFKTIGRNRHGIIRNAYTAPWPDGTHITNISPNTYLGPVENFLEGDRFTTICVRGWWINVWGSAPKGKVYAHNVPTTIVQAWYARGWRDHDRT